MDEITIKTVGRFSITYCHIERKVKINPGLLLGLFRDTFFIGDDYRIEKAIRVFLMSGYSYVTSNEFGLSKSSEENKRHMEEAVADLEYKAMQLNKLYDEEEKKERIMLSMVVGKKG